VRKVHLNGDPLVVGDEERARLRLEVVLFRKEMETSGIFRAKVHHKNIIDKHNIAILLLRGNVALGSAGGAVKIDGERHCVRVSLWKKFPWEFLCFNHLVFSEINEFVGAETSRTHIGWDHV
jgi:hypothetical protein